MKPRLHRTVIVDEGRTYIVQLSFITEQQSQNGSPVSVSVVSVKPCTIMGESIKKEP